MDLIAGAGPSISSSKKRFISAQGPSRWRAWARKDRGVSGMVFSVRVREAASLISGVRRFTCAPTKAGSKGGDGGWGDVDVEGRRLDFVLGQLFGRPASRVLGRAGGCVAAHEEGARWYSSLGHLALAKYKGRHRFTETTQQDGLGKQINSTAPARFDERPKEWAASDVSSGRWRASISSTVYGWLRRAR